MIKKEKVSDNDSGSDSTKNSTEVAVDESKIEPTLKDILPYFNAPGAFVLAAIILPLGGNFFISIWVSFVLMPLVDTLLPLDDKNVSKEAQKKFEKDWRFKVPLYFVLIFDFTFYFYMLWGVTTGRIGNNIFELIVYIIGGAILGATNTTAGHELFHKRQLVHKVFGILPWFKMLSGHLYMYHL
jgi:hypothetical protein